MFWVPTTEGTSVKNVTMNVTGISAGQVTEYEVFGNAESVGFVWKRMDDSWVAGAHSGLTRYGINTPEEAADWLVDNS
jgi:hypothetical protein